MPSTARKSSKNRVNSCVSMARLMRMVPLSTSLARRQHTTQRGDQRPRNLIGLTSQLAWLEPVPLDLQPRGMATRFPDALPRLMVVEVDAIDIQLKGHMEGTHFHRLPGGRPAAARVRVL